MRRILAGQVLLVICCVFYLTYWALGYRPGETVSRVSGKVGLLLGATLLFGLAGIGFTFSGTLQPYPAGWQGNLRILAAGAVFYAAALFVTGVLLRRPVTSELFLITIWTVLELCAVNSLHAAGEFSADWFYSALCLILLAAGISLVLYVLYYRVEEWRAYYLAMVPLVTEGLVMLLLALLLAREI